MIKDTPTKAGNTDKAVTVGRKRKICVEKQAETVMQEENTNNGCEDKAVIGNVTKVIGKKRQLCVEKKAETVIKQQKINNGFENKT